MIQFSFSKDDNILTFNILCACALCTCRAVLPFSVETDPLIIK